LLSIFILLTEYFKTGEKSKVAMVTFEVSETENPKADNVFELTNYKRIFLQVRSNRKRFVASASDGTDRSKKE
jgi:hypothetical protein